MRERSCPEAECGRSAPRHWSTSRPAANDPASGSRRKPGRCADKLPAIPCRHSRAAPGSSPPAWPRRRCPRDSTNAPARADALFQGPPATRDSVSCVGVKAPLAIRDAIAAARRVVAGREVAACCASACSWASSSHSFSRSCCHARHVQRVGRKSEAPPASRTSPVIECESRRTTSLREDEALALTGCFAVSLVKSGRFAGVDWSWLWVLFVRLDALGESPRGCAVPFASGRDISAPATGPARWPGNQACPLRDAWPAIPGRRGSAPALPDISGRFFRRVGRDTDSAPAGRS